MTTALLTAAWRRTGFLHIVIAGTLLSASGCAWLDAHQRQIIYRPTQAIPADFAGLRAGDENYFLAVAQSATRPDADPADTAQRINVWWLPHPDKDAPTLLYFHGTFRNLFHNLHKIEALRAAGFAVLAVDYRGWGRSTPITPSEQSILQDADTAWAELQRREPRAAQRVIYGHSMGSGVAVDLSSRLRPGLDFGALIVESAFTSFPELAREAGFLSGVLANFNKERFASIEKIGRVHAPVLMIHGSADTTIPIRLGEKLFAAANPPKHWLTIESGAHSDLDQTGGVQYQTAIRCFMKQTLQPGLAPDAADCGTSPP